jgi:hypothetical protein
VCLNVTLVMLCGPFIVNFLLCYPNVPKILKDMPKFSGPLRVDLSLVNNNIS